MIHILYELFRYALAITFCDSAYPRQLFHFFHPHRHILSSPHLNPNFSFINFRKFFCGHIPGVDQFNLVLLSSWQRVVAVQWAEEAVVVQEVAFAVVEAYGIPSFLRGFPG